MSKPVDMAFFERLKQAVDHARVPLSQAAIGNRLGGVDRRTVDRWFGGGLPSPEKLFLIADTFKVDARWLASGRGQMLHTGEGATLEPHEEELLQRYRDADPRWRLSLRLLACLATEEQIEASADVNMVIARIFGKKPSEIRYPSDKKVRAFKGDAPHVARSKDRTRQS